MCQAMFGTWDTEVNKAGQKTKCYGAYILPLGAYIKLYSSVRSKLIEFCHGKYGCVFTRKM